MSQLELEYFFPLTQQYLLLLDYTPCYEYAEAKRKEMSNTYGTYITSAGIGNVAFTALTGSTAISNTFTINIDKTPITVVSKKKPNFIKRYVYKMLGMTWKSE